MLMRFAILNMFLIITACGGSSDSSVTPSSATLGYPSKDISDNWVWVSGDLKLTETRDEFNLILSSLAYDQVYPNMYFDWRFRNGANQWGPIGHIKADVTFLNTDFSWISLDNITQMDCDQDLLVACDQAPNGVKANQGTPYSATIQYYSDGTRLTVCMDGACGEYIKN